MKISNLISGRINRRSYFIGSLFCWIIILLPGILFLTKNFDFLLSIAIFISILWISAIIFVISLIVRRFHDIGMSGWEILILPLSIILQYQQKSEGVLYWLPLLISLLSIILLLYLIFCSGIKRENKYGPMPDKKLNIRTILGLI